MAFEIVYKRSVGKDLSRLGRAEARRILDAIEKKLSASADEYLLLRGKFAGLRKLRLGDYQVIFAVLGKQALVLRIGHRSRIYDKP